MLLLICVAVLVAGLSTVHFALQSLHPYNVVDEVYHVAIADAYLAGNFTYWHPKVTTPPGLYLVTYAILKPLSFTDFTEKKIESLEFLRMVNAIGMIFNFLIVYYILKTLWKKMSEVQVILSTVIIALHPLIVPYGFLYYTDVFSLTAILLTYLMHINGLYALAFPAGIWSLLMRQTNIVWLFFISLNHAIDVYDEHMYPRVSGKRKKKATQSTWTRFVNFGLDLLGSCWPYLFHGLAFLAFITWNDGHIVLGDQSSHTPTLHIPQLLYFAAVYLLFHFPSALVAVFPRRIKTRTFLSYTFVLTVLAFLAIHYNTLVHPYLLADNRHISFYVWNKFFLKYPDVAPYAVVPVYLLGFYALKKSTDILGLQGQLLMAFCTALTLVPQRLFEFRYFIVPLVFCRLHLPPPPSWAYLLCELVLAGASKVALAYVFWYRQFFWADFEEPQRIIWGLGAFIGGKYCDHGLPMEVIRERKELNVQRVDYMVCVKLQVDYMVCVKLQVDYMVCVKLQVDYMVCVKLQVDYMVCVKLQVDYMVCVKLQVDYMVCVKLQVDYMVCVKLQVDYMVCVKLQVDYMVCVKLQVDYMVCVKLQVDYMVCVKLQVDYMVCVKLQVDYMVCVKLQVDYMVCVKLQVDYMVCVKLQVDYMVCVKLQVDYMVCVKLQVDYMVCVKLQVDYMPVDVVVAMGVGAVAAGSCCLVTENRPRACLLSWPLEERQNRVGLAASRRWFPTDASLLSDSSGEKEMSFFREL
ncbi:unnamed protein product [Cyprideis torosa]|uniref:Dol-P-Glc:Glc(2)Man(9)GlcNAc(2)-PP-Dol alpha-1,2-glucosyltransferase n=1 Tax=Cyprideis torosa TaxID=163714 RepID=A0A7R8W3K8_9CRUS|nr:unnamed protein product [Cyprideis torosa]CAG0883110.1 unnamed protein product [Cyprideis torosa]